MITREQLIDREELVAWLSTDVDAIFEEHKGNCRFFDDPNRRHLFFGNKSRILAVCHLDTVQPLFAPEDVKITDRKIIAPGLDDRLGAYVLSKLAAWGMPCDLLMCDNEERGASTAEFFNTNKKYNWVVEFDRKGTDIVRYSIDNDPFETYVKDIGHGYTTGSFTDICKLNLNGNPFMFNMGVGYTKAHAKDSYALIDELHYNMVRFQMIWAKFSETKLTAKERTYSSRGSGSGYYNNKPKKRYKWIKGVCVRVHMETGEVLSDGDCDHCWGYGYNKWNSKCYWCDGTGREDKKGKSEKVKTRKPGDPCRACEGTGKNSYGNRCTPCKGTGKWRVEEKEKKDPDPPVIVTYKRDFLNGSGQAQWFRVETRGTNVKMIPVDDPEEDRAERTAKKCQKLLDEEEKIDEIKTLISWEERKLGNKKRWYRVETKGSLTRIYPVDDPKKDKQRLLDSGLYKIVDEKKEEEPEEEEFIDESSISPQRRERLVPWTTRGLLDSDTQDETSCPECHKVHLIAEVLVIDECPNCGHYAFEDELNDNVNNSCYECDHLDYEDDGSRSYRLICPKKGGAVISNTYAIDNDCGFFTEFVVTKNLT